MYAAEHAPPPFFVLAVPDALHAVDDLEALAREVVLRLELLVRGKHWIEDIVVPGRERGLGQDALTAGDGPVVRCHLALE